MNTSILNENHNQRHLQVVMKTPSSMQKCSINKIKEGGNKREVKMRGGVREPVWKKMSERQLVSFRTHNWPTVQKHGLSLVEGPDYNGAGSSGANPCLFRPQGRRGPGDGCCRSRGGPLHHFCSGDGPRPWYNVWVVLGYIQRFTARPNIMTQRSQSRLEDSPSTSQPF